MSSYKNETLVNDLLKMVDNPHLSDLVLVCEDGVEVHACRMLLAARSLFFRKMLLNGMAESGRERSIALPTVSSAVLVIILKFLYAEALLYEDISKKNSPVSFGYTQHTRYRPVPFLLDWELLLKVIVAVRFLMVEQLEKVIIERLWNDTFRLDCRELSVMKPQEKTAVARNLSVLCEYPMLWNAHKVIVTDDVFCPHPRWVESIEVICFHLLQIMVFTELNPATLFYFSKTAFQFYLSNTQRTSSDRTWDGCLEEYMRLREVITWCVVSAADTEAAIENLDRTCLPEPEIALRFLRECVESSPAEARSKSIVDFSRGRESFVENIFREDLDKFLGMVDLVSIHPELLVAVIEPLNLIDLSRIYSAQSMRGLTRLRGNGMCQVTDIWQWAGWGLYSLRTRFSNNLTFTVSYTTPVDEFTRVDEFSLLSVAELKMEFSRRTFEWEIVVIPHGGFEQRLSMDLLEIGFYRLRRGETLGMRMGKHRMKTDKYRTLSESCRGSVLSISEREEKFCDKKSSTESSGLVAGDGSPHDLWDSPITVIVDRDEGTCFFSCGIDGLTFPIDNAEDEIFYPAIHIFSYVDSACRPHYERLTVRIQNMKGFDQPE